MSEATGGRRSGCVGERGMQHQFRVLDRQQLLRAPGRLPRSLSNDTLDFFLVKTTFDYEYSESGGPGAGRQADVS